MQIDDKCVVPLTLLVQAGVTAGVAVLLGALYGATAGVSALLGGIAAVAPNAFLAARLMAPRDRDGAEAILRAARVGVIGKMAMTAVLFGVIFATVRPIWAPGVFGGFIAAQTVVLGALLFGGGALNVNLGAKS